MQTVEVAQKLVDLCRRGENLKAIDSLYSKDIVSIEAADMPNMPAEMRGVEAIKQKNKQWIESQDVHSVDVSGPFPHGDQFAVMYKFDATDRKSGKRYDMEEVALYTVKDDKIVKEEFFYKM